MTSLAAEDFYPERPAKFSFNHSQKAFVLTVALYAIIAATLYVSFQHFHGADHKDSNLKQVAISASMFSVAPPKPKVEPIKKVVPPVKPVVHKPEPVKKIHKPVKIEKPVKKIIPKPIHKTVTKPIPVKKVAPTKPIKPIQQEKVVKPEPTKTVAPVVKQAQPTKSPTVVQNAPSKAQQASAEASYTAELQQALAQYAQNTYPFMAKRRNWEGSVEVTFTLHRNGDITDVVVSKPDMRDIFNQAAKSIFTEEMQMHFKPFPKNITRDTWSLSVPISYTLR